MELIRHYFPDITPEQEGQFERLQELYVDWNAKINVISRKNMEVFYVNHVLHSLAIAKFYDLSKHTSILDIGTGGGFPGIPLAILYPSIQFMLVDSIGKKIKVVNGVVEALKLTNVNTEVNRFENIETKYTCIVSRAVAPALKLYQLTEKANAKNGTHIFLKGGDLQNEKNELLANYRSLAWNEHAISSEFKEEFFETKKVVIVK